MNRYYVYILKCSDNSYYTGITSNLEKRLMEHQSGKYPKSYTHNRRPVELVFHTEFNDVTQAIAFEKQVKGWSRKKKEAIINGNWDLLPSLSACKNDSHYKGFCHPERSRGDASGFDSAQPDKCG